VKHFSYYVKPTAKKVTVTGNYADQVGFQNPDGSIVAVLENQAASATQVSVTFGTNMVNVSLPPNSFATAVVYDSTANNVIYGYNAHAERNALIKVTKRGNSLILTPDGNSFEIQLLGINGSRVASFSSRQNKNCEIRTNELSPGMYVMKGLINGKRYYSALPIVNP
jgi:hypothetical protein